MKRQLGGIWYSRKIISRLKYAAFGILFLFTITCSMTSTILAALSANVGSGFSVFYEPPPTDLWNASQKTFYRQNVNNLLKQISGDETSSVDNMTKVNELATSKTTSADMREFNVGKASGEDITVLFGGLTWTVTYLSTDKDGDAILTLWLDDSSQLSGKKYDTNKTFNEKGMATWSSGWYNTSTIVDYPSAMYGTSYMSAVVLNNGGQYAHSTANNSSDITLVSVDQNPDSAFALFTMENFGLTQYLVTPEQVSWQESGQSTKTLIGISYNYPNENWSMDTPNDGFYSSRYNYAHKTGNDGWKNDYLWLPSLSETGGTNSYKGIWKTSTDQGDNFPWLRSGDCDAGAALRLNSAGSSSGWGGFLVYYSSGVRPALHLNLTAAVDSLK